MREREREREKYQCVRETHNLLVYVMMLQLTEPPGQGEFPYVFVLFEFYIHAKESIKISLEKQSH